MLACDGAQHFDAVHARHFEVESDHMRMQLSDFFQSECAVHCSAHYFNLRIASEDLRNHLAHQRRIIDDENSDALAHAVAPSGAFDIFEMTVATLRIKTTVPSPRIDAPLTRSEAAVLSSSAFITNSSSPTSRSTTRPNFRGPVVITITKSRLDFRSAAAVVTATDPADSRRT